MGNIVTKNGVMDFSNFVSPDQDKIVPVDITPVQPEPIPEPVPLPEPIPEQAEDPEVGIDPEPQIGKTKSKK